jgi:propionate kinase
MSSASLVLVINCGSSSLKFSVIPRHQETPVLCGLAEKLGLRDACITFNDAQGNKTSGWLNGGSHTCALEALFARLAGQALLPQVCAIGHRVAHGGNDFKHSVRLTAPVIERIRELSALARCTIPPT